MELFVLWLFLFLNEPNWKIYKPQRAEDATLKGILKDLQTHLPPNHRNDYSKYERMTWAHEATHGVQAEIRLWKFGFNALYVGDGRYVLLPEPKTTIAAVATTVPKTLHTSRFTHYLITQQAGWNSTPLYLFDEWTAYTNELVCGWEYKHEYKNKPGKSDTAYGFLELGVYSAFCMKHAYDNGYKDQNLKKYFRWNFDRGLRYHKRLVKMSYFNWDNGAFLKKMKSNKEFTSILEEYYGKDFVKECFKE